MASPGASPRVRLPLVIYGERDYRQREVRAHTVNIRTMRHEQKGQPVTPYHEEPRPKMWGECESTERPCPWASCKFHLYLDQSPAGLKFNFPDVDPEDFDQLPATCALDAADEGGLNLEQVGVLMNMTRERVRQIEEGAMRKIEPALRRLLGERP
jgi:hypothetical protein